MEEQCETGTEAASIQESIDNYNTMCDSVYRYTQMMRVANMIAMLITLVCTFFVYLNCGITALGGTLFLVVVIVTWGNIFLFGKLGKGFASDDG